MRNQQVGRQIRKVAIIHISRAILQNWNFKKNSSRKAEVFEMLISDPILLCEFFSLFCSLPTCIALFFWHLLLHMKISFFEAGIKISKCWKCQQKRQQLNILNVWKKNTWIRLSKLRGLSRTRPMLSTENHDNRTSQIINFVTQVSFCFPFENKLPRATIAHSKMQNAPERGKEDLVDSLSSLRRILLKRSWV